MHSPQPGGTGSMIVSPPRAQEGPTLQDGSLVPFLVYGTTIRPQPGPQPTVDLAIKRGYRALDTASTRRFHDEAADGRGLARALSSAGDSAMQVGRASLLVQTKYTPPEFHPRDAATWPYSIGNDPPTRVLKSLSRSLSELRVDVIDVYFFHSILDSIADTVEAWKALEQVCFLGGIRYLGLSNVCIAALREVWTAVTLKPAFVQNCFAKRSGPQREGYDIEVVEFCRDHGIMYQIFGVFSHNNEWLLESDPVERLVRRQGLSPQQAVLCLLLYASKLVNLQLCVLDGTTKEEHMRDNLAVTELSEPPSEDVVEDFLQLLGWKPYVV